MATTKLTPRQKMINMMYLVLTALLAMNVSREVLHAFKIVQKGIATSNETIQSRNADYYKTFQELSKQEQSEGFLKIYSLSLETQNKTKEILDYISAIQKEIKEKSGTEEVDGEIELKQPDDLNTATLVLTEKIDGKIKGDELREKLDGLRTDYLDIIDKGNLTLKGSDSYKDYKTMYASVIPLKEQSPQIKGMGNEMKSWAVYNFAEMPVLASDVILEKLKSDIINSETQILDYLLRQTKGNVIDFDHLEAKVIAPKSYLASGKTYEADIFISASSSKTEMDVFVGKIDKSKFNGSEKLFMQNGDLPFIGSYKTLDVSNGRATLSEIAGSAGVKNYEGIIRVKQPNGGYELYPFYADYEVAPPSGMSVSPTKMNVLYAGVDNPIQIAVNGAKSDKDVKVSISQGSITKDGSGKYIAKVNQPGKATIAVSALVNDKQETFAPMEFRVLPIPMPDISMCGIKKKRMSKNEILACSGLIAQNENFVFDVRFEILSFDVVVNTKGNENKRVKNNGALYNNDARKLLESLSPKDNLIIDNVLVRDPAGNKREVNGALFVEVQ